MQEYLHHSDQFVSKWRYGIGQLLIMVLHKLNPYNDSIQQYLGMRMNYNVTTIYFMNMVACGKPALQF